MELVPEHAAPGRRPRASCRPRRPTRSRGPTRPSFITIRQCRIPGCPMISPFSRSISARASSVLSGRILNLVIRDCIGVPPAAGHSVAPRAGCARVASLARLDRRAESERSFSGAERCTDRPSASTTPGPGLTEFTREVARWLATTGAREGLLTLFVRHTSCSLLIQENADPSVRDDLETFLAPPGPAADDPASGWITHRSEGPGRHAGAPQGRAPAGVADASRSRDGRLALGTWQGIYLWEHRARPHRRAGRRPPRLKVRRVPKKKARDLHVPRPYRLQRTLAYTRAAGQAARLAAPVCSIAPTRGAIARAIRAAISSSSTAGKSANWRNAPELLLDRRAQARGGVLSALLKHGLLLSLPSQCHHFASAARESSAISFTNARGACKRTAAR